jgi:tetratricopeptide (TPR) repeat protein
LPPDVPDISEELVLGRTLLEQGHLGTAQRVLVKVCQKNPENAEAFRGLSEVLRRKGDPVRARVIGDYAQDLREGGGLKSPSGGAKASPMPKPGKPPPVPPASQPTTPARGVGSPAKPDTPGVEFITPEPGTPSAELISVEEDALPVPSTEPTMPSPGLAPTSPAATMPSPPAAPKRAPTMPSPGPSPASPALTMPGPPAIRAAGSSAAQEQSPVRASPAPAAKSGKGKAWAVVVVLLLLAGAGIVGYRFLRPLHSRPTFSPREELDSALASGSFDRLMHIREKARIALEGPEPEADALVRLALTDAVLALDYRVAAAKSADEALRRMPPADPTKPQRLALVEAVRGLLALDAGDRMAARQHVDAGLAKVAAQPLPILLFASARLHSLAGETAAAGDDLDRALAMAPDFAPVVADWALQRLDAGDPDAARRVLKDFLVKNKAASRVHLAAADVERALGEGAWKKHVEPACRGENRGSRALRGACLLESAQEARLDGERVSAVRKARAAAQTSDDPRVLADSALVLALEGEVDIADEVLGRARKLAADTAVPLAWADLAIRLGRGQAEVPTPPSDKPVLPERFLLVVRAAYLKGGGSGMAAVVKDVPQGLVEIDADLRTFIELGREGGPSRAERAALERRADRGNPVAAFVVGVLAAREDDHKQAAKRLEKALAGHGDSCRAALLYISALQAENPPGQPNRAALRALHGRCAACPIPEM